MKYRSTRGVPSNVTFEQSLFIGWADDGGLLIPEYIPKLTKEELLSWSSYSYQEICMEMFKLFAGDDFVSTYKLKTLFKEAHTSFPEKVIPLKKINEYAYVLELFHGPTHSFKDIALSVAGPLLDLVLKTRNKQGIVYVATSGDTGSAVINSTKRSSNIDVITFFPGGKRITDLQRLLMTTVKSKRIHTFSGDCYCDDFDIFFLNFSSELHKKYPELVVTSLNSLTWVRVLMQCCHVVHTYMNVAKDFEEVTFVIPTGGGGHVTSALISKMLGLPIKIKCAFNDKNLNLHNFLVGKEFLYDIPVNKSTTCAMDIQMPPNIDRLIYLLTDGNVDEVKQYMESWFKQGSMKASDGLLQKIREHISIFVSSDEDILATMKRCWNEHDYVIDPHTACGFGHFYTREESSTEITVYMGCASPIKFTEELLVAGIPIPEYHTNYFDDLKQQEEHSVELPSNRDDWMSFLMSYIDENIARRYEVIHDSK